MIIPEQKPRIYTEYVYCTDKNIAKNFVFKLKFNILFCFI